MATKKTVKVTKNEPTVSSGNTESLFEKMRLDLSKNQSFLNMVLGALVVLVMGVLLFNYFNNQNPNELANQPQPTDMATEMGDVAVGDLPGSYIVKEGDTLFTIAERYYDDGFQYSAIVEANKLQNANSIEVGQTLQIPLIEGVAQASASPEAIAAASPSASPVEVAQATAQPTALATQIAQATPAPEVATGGAENQTVWGEKITGDTYTVQEGDWLSKIAGRAYGDVMTYEKLAQANNIANPNLIEPGMVIKIAR